MNHPLTPTVAFLAILFLVSASGHAVKAPDLDGPGGPPIVIHPEEELRPLVGLAASAAGTALGIVEGLGGVGGPITGGCNAQGSGDAACQFLCAAGNTLSLSVRGENTVNGEVNCGGARFICGPRERSCSVGPGCCAEVRGSGICYGHSDGWYFDHVSVSCTARENTADAAAAPGAFAPDAEGLAQAKAAIDAGLLESVVILAFTPSHAVAYACGAAGCVALEPDCAADALGVGCRV